VLTIGPPKNFVFFYNHSSGFSFLQPLPSVLGEVAVNIVDGPGMGNDRVEVTFF